MDIKSIVTRFASVSYRIPDLLLAGGGFAHRPDWLNRSSWPQLAPPGTPRDARRFAPSGHAHARSPPIAPEVSYETPRCPALADDGRTRKMFLAPPHSRLAQTHGTLAHCQSWPSPFSPRAREFFILASPYPINELGRVPLRTRPSIQTSPCLFFVFYLNSRWPRFCSRWRWGACRLSPCLHMGDSSHLNRQACL